MVRRAKTLTGVIEFDDEVRQIVLNATTKSLQSLFMSGDLFDTVNTWNDFDEIVGATVYYASLADYRAGKSHSIREFFEPTPNE